MAFIHFAPYKPRECRRSSEWLRGTQEEFPGEMGDALQDENIPFPLTIRLISERYERPRVLRADLDELDESSYRVESAIDRIELRTAEVKALQREQQKKTEKRKREPEEQPSADEVAETDTGEAMEVDTPSSGSTDKTDSPASNEERRRQRGHSVPLEGKAHVLPPDRDAPVVEARGYFIEALQDLCRTVLVLKLMHPRWDPRSIENDARHKEWCEELDDMTEEQVVQVEKDMGKLIVDCERKVLDYLSGKLKVFDNLERFSAAERDQGGKVIRSPNAQEKLEDLVRLIDWNNVSL